MQALLFSFVHFKMGVKLMSTSEESQLFEAEKLERIRAQVTRAVVLKNKGMSNRAIAKEMALTESIVHTLLAAPNTANPGVVTPYTS